jgi:hypothetical protein
MRALLCSLFLAGALIPAAWLGAAAEAEALPSPTLTALPAPVVEAPALAPTAAPPRGASAGSFIGLALLGAVILLVITIATGGQRAPVSGGR